MRALSPYLLVIDASVVHCSGFCILFACGLMRLCASAEVELLKKVLGKKALLLETEGLKCML